MTSSASRRRRPSAPQRAFASSSLRPFLIAALLESAPFRDRPALVVAADDRMARDLALDLRAFLAPAPVRFYPARGVRYESHLAPPPHLVGLRIAALDSLLEPPAGEAPVVVASAVALMERIPDPELRPHGFAIAVGEELDLDETLERLVACGYEREEQVFERGQFAVRGGILDVYPATEERAVRVELFGDEVESLRWFSTFTQRSLEDAERVEIAPAAELDAEYRELAEMAASRSRSRAARHRRGAARGRLPLLPRADAGENAVRAGGRRGGAAAGARRPLAGRHHQPPLRRRARPLPAAGACRARRSRTRAEVTPVRGLIRPAAPVPRAGRRHRRAHDRGGRAGAGEAGALRLRRRSSPGTGAARPSAPRTTSPGCGRGFVDDGRARSARACGSRRRALREGFIAPQLKIAVIPDHRLLRRRRAERPEGTRGRAFQAFTELRPGDIVVHTDHGIGRFTGFDTKTVAGVTRDYLEVEYRDGDRVFVPTDQLDQSEPLRGRRGRCADAVQARLQDLGQHEGAAPSARRRSWRAS